MTNPRTLTQFLLISYTENPSRQPASITAIDIAIRIGKELGDQGGCILPLRKDHFGGLGLARIPGLDQSA